MSEATLKYNPDLNSHTESRLHRDESLRLLSINQARKLLRIRHETLKGLIEAGQIGFIELEGKTKIPFQALIKFIENNTTINSHQSTNSVEQDINTIIFKK